MSTVKPAVSVIIPAYNRQDTIGEAVFSALGQTRGDIEVIVVDDGSTDGTEAVVRSIKDPRVRFIRTGHVGSVAARNEGFRRASGEAIALLDSDDVWMPRKLERQLEMLERHPDLLAVVSNVTLFGNCLERPLWMAWRHRRLRFKKVLKGDFIIFSTLLMRAWVPEKLGLLDASPQVVGTEDLDYCLRLLHHRGPSCS
jgi:glycosyltransferase involved in cell wall biosynthesis